MTRFIVDSTPAARRAGSVLVALLASAIAGCAAPRLQEMPDDPAYAPLTANTPAPDFHAQGAIRYARFGSSLWA